MDNIQYCQMIIKSEPDEIDPLKSCLSSFELQVKTEVEDDACNQSEIQDTKDDSKQDNSNISCDEITTNVAQKVTTTMAKEIEKGRLEKIVENITKKTRRDRISKESQKHQCSARERSEMIVKSFLPGDKGSFTPIHYKGVVIMKEANQRCYDLRREDLDKFKREIDDFVTYCCEDCDYTTEYFAMFKVHFMTHANMKFLVECVNTSTTWNRCYLCDFKCSVSEELDRHINVHRNKSMVELNKKSMDDSEVVQPMVDSSTVPHDDASIKTESTSPASNENMQEDNEKLKQSEKCSVSGRKGVTESNNGVNKSKKIIVTVKEQHVDESEIQPDVPEHSEDSIDKKVFKIEFISAAADDNEYLNSKNTSSGNIAKDRRQASRQLKTCSKRNSVVEEINDSKKSEKESSDEEDDYKDYDDGNSFHDDEEDTVDKSHLVKVTPLCVVKIEKDPDIAAASCSNHKVHFKITNKNKKIRLTKSPSESTRNSRKDSHVCDKCNKICSNEYILKRHISSHHSGFIIHLGDKRFKCGVCNAVRNRIICIKKHIHLKHCSPDKKICGLDGCIKGEAMELVCKECAQIFYSKVTLKDHIREKHSVGNTFDCVFCDKKFQIPLYLRRHEKKHYCQWCSFKSNSIEETLKHTKTHAERKKLAKKSAKKPGESKIPTSKESCVCDTCGKICSNEYILKRHVELHQNNVIINLSDKRFKCGLCNAVQDRISNIKLHVHLLHCTPDKKICGLDNCIKGDSLELICNDCGLKFLSKITLKDHIREKHSVGRTFDCSLCGKKFKKSRYKTKHEKNHFCPYCPFQSNSIVETFKHTKTHPDEKKVTLRCELCNYKTNNNELFEAHVFRHNNPKPFACSQCDYKSKLKFNLLMHEKSHISVMTYSCTLCKFQTNRLGDLLKHKKTHGSEGEVSMIEDVSTRDPRFVYCDRCEYKTKYPTYLKTHKMKHDNIRPYLCPVCGATFSSALDLFTHKKNVHFKKAKSAPLKFFKCSYCDYKYHVKQTVMVHERKHTGEKPYHCNLCTFSTSFTGNLSAHKKKHHPVVTPPS